MEKATFPVGLWCVRQSAFLRRLRREPVTGEVAEGVLQSASFNKLRARSKRQPCALLAPPVIPVEKSLQSNTQATIIVSSLGFLLSVGILKKSNGIILDF